MDPILYWNDVALEANKVSHTATGGEQTGPTLSSRALAIVHLAMHDAYFGVHPGPDGLYLQDVTGLPAAGENAEAAVAAAACASLADLYPSQRPVFEAAALKAGIPADGAAQSGRYGRAVADAIVAKLAIGADEPGASDQGYCASSARGRHRQDPDNPGQKFHAPFYGATARRIAVTQDWSLNQPPAPDHDEDMYKAALVEVRGKGGAPGLSSTTREPHETLIGIFWAYDGVPGLGSPPRLYNQIVRTIADSRGNSAAENARLFAMVNAAMGDAGVLAWQEKYDHDLWRPVLGVREHDPAMGPTGEPGHAIDPCCDPFWLPLGAPKTNTTEKNFTPPFPAYPSGHATFGAAAFQAVRLFYEYEAGLPDNIAFDVVSGELDGASTDRNGTVRTRHERHFDSLWQAIFENGLSRVYLGVHWAFDAFAASDVKCPDGTYKDPADITYASNVGGVPLGLAIANDIKAHGLICREPAAPAAARGSSKPRVNTEPTYYSR